MIKLHTDPAHGNVDKQTAKAWRAALRAEQRCALRLQRYRAATYSTRVSRMRGRLS